MRVALYGGSFDPPHVGHLLATAYVLGTARVERLLMVPCFLHPFDKRLSPFEHRLAMARLAAAPFAGRVEVSDVERRLGGPSRTLRTVKALLAERPGDTLALVIGADLLGERERWHGYAELSGLVEFAVVGRAGYGPAPGAKVQIPDVSSTEIRARVRRGEPVDGLVVAEVADYIAAHGLYGDEPERA
jgi:nicotinate-nucleotide adenylyltransferase